MISKHVIRRCTKCNTSVHLKCYQATFLGMANLEDLEDSDFCCLKCRESTKHGFDQGSIRCLLCCQPTKGLLITMSSDFYQWCHLVCALYLRRVVSIEKLPIDGIQTSSVVWLGEAENPPDKAFPCPMCKESTGYMISCQEEGCQNRFHV